jgi:hypothetical protein
MIRREVVTVTTNASGDGTGYSGHVSGLVRAIRYVKVDYDNGIDATITADASGQAILTFTDVNASASSYPHAAMNTVTNAASLYAAAGQAVLTPIPVADERIKIVVAQGGNVKTGTFHIYIQS